MYAQPLMEYNTKGDEASLKKDFQTALSWYNEGLVSCDMYSISKVYDIWKNQPDLQESMQLDMITSFNCLKKQAEAEDSDAMRMLGDFYNNGIGTEKDSTTANNWLVKWGKATGIPVAPITDNSDETKTPRKSLLSNRFCSFLTYTYSPTMPLGFTAGIYFDKIGGYVGFRTDLKSINAEYECNNTSVSGIEIENPLYEFNRERWQSRMITGGLLYPVIKNRLFVSAGGGYGERNYYREIITNEIFQTGNKSEWCLNTEASYKGLTLEVGGMYIWKKLVVTGGVNSTRFKDLDVYFGLGLTF